MNVAGYNNFPQTSPAVRPPTRGCPTQPPWHTCPTITLPDPTPTSPAPCPPPGGLPEGHCGTAGPAGGIRASRRGAAVQRGAWGVSDAARHGRTGARGVAGRRITCKPWAAARSRGSPAARPAQQQDGGNTGTSLLIVTLPCPRGALAAASCRQRPMAPPLEPVLAPICSRKAL